jgi:urease gamma subunit
MFAQEFNERAAANMEMALERACQRLPVNRNDHETRRLIAEKIIECARSGKTTLSELTAAGIEAVRHLNLK